MRNILYLFISFFNLDIFPIFFLFIIFQINKKRRNILLFLMSWNKIKRKRKEEKKKGEYIRKLIVALSGKF